MDVESSPKKVHAAVREARRRGLTIGCVPTMGALHAGHVSLVQRARSENEFVVATIFVNPTQFGPTEDFSRYPRTLDADLEFCRAAGADLVFTPQVADMYAADAETIVRVTGLSTVLEGAHRPGHFDGVTTVVTKLFQITEPDRAYFGQKDYQQQLIIRRMVQDLNIPVTIVTCPIVREADGLAMSSRNRYLSPEERRIAAEIFQALQLADRLAVGSAMSPREIAERMRAHLEGTGGLSVQYAVVADSQSLVLQETRIGGGSGVALIAAKLGTTRLIDNQILNYSVAE
ncbi:MAG: Pantothenate synthetase [Planctomycetota bacterium]|jgi:pantoate--beta-alanine ligase